MKRRKSSSGHPAELPLTPMIDLFSILVIFLILGTVFTSTEVDLPANFFLPKSKSLESSEAAPQATIHDNKLIVNFLGKQEIEIANLSNTPEGTALGSAIKDYTDKLPDELKRSGVLLNLVADQETPYEKIFAASRFFRMHGFQSVLFLAEGAAK